MDAPKRCTLIISVLDSHEVVRRQLLHIDGIMKRNPAVAAAVTVLLIDDGSSPPHTDVTGQYPWLRQHWTHDFRPWTEAIARNIGAAMCSTPYLFFTDIDHIIPESVFEYAAKFTLDFANFKRRLGDLNASGVIENVGKVLHSHPNTFLIKLEQWRLFGGYKNKSGIWGCDRQIRSWWRSRVKKKLMLMHSGPAVLAMTSKHHKFHDLRNLGTSPAPQPRTVTDTGFKLTLIINELDSNEFARRQLLHLDRIISDLRCEKSMQVLMIDDGSKPPLPAYDYPWLRQHWTHDFRPWTQGIARNVGVKMSETPYILCFDVDHVVTRDILDFAMRFDGDFALFPRRIGSLDETGQEVNLGARIRKTPENIYLMRRELFFRWGGYPNRPGRHCDVWIIKSWRRDYKRGTIKIGKGPMMLACKDTGFFHGLKR